MIHGRFIVSAWEFSLEGIQDDAVKLLSLAVEVGTVLLAVGHFLRTRAVIYITFLWCFVFLANRSTTTNLFNGPYPFIHGYHILIAVTGRQHLRSAAQQKLIVPRFRRKMFGCQAYSVASPSVWNALPDSLRDPELTLDIIRRQLKTYFFTLY